MKKFLLLFAILLSPTIACAGDEAFECNKEFDGEVVCKVKKDKVVVKAVTLNGGECPSPLDPKICGKKMKKGDKFKLSGTQECLYVSGVTITTADGKSQWLFPY